MKKWDIKYAITTRVYPEVGAGGAAYQSLPRSWSWRCGLPEFTQKRVVYPEEGSIPCKRVVVRKERNTAE